MAATDLPLDANRLWGDVMALAEITDPERPYTRRSFSRFSSKAALGSRGDLRRPGLAVRIDTAGNLIGRLDGDDPTLGVIAIGSHSDTVPSGGRFDGIAGVATGLEIARALRDGRAATITRSRSSIFSPRSRANTVCPASAAAG